MDTGISQPLRNQQNHGKAALSVTGEDVFSRWGLGVPGMWDEKFLLGWGLCTAQMELGSASSSSASPREGGRDGRRDGGMEGDSQQCLNHRGFPRISRAGQGWAGDGWMRSAP